MYARIILPTESATQFATITESQNILELRDVSPQVTLAGIRLLGYDAQALTITAVRHLLILLADLLAAISVVGLFAILCLMFQGARAVAAAETGRRRP